MTDKQESLFNSNEQDIPESIKKKIRKLVNELDAHFYRYHVLDNPVVSDVEYDRLYNELKILEEQYSYVLPESPTQRVGKPPLDKFNKIKHTEPMLSLANAFSFDDLKDFSSRLKRKLNSQSELDFTVEPKYDGLAIEFSYKKGLLYSASTRGDGNEGEDVTQNIRTIKAVPLKINDAPDEIDIRGEVYMNTKDFEAINKKREKKGEPAFSNPRNAAAGAIRQLDSRITAKRKLDLVCYGLGYLKGKKFNNQMEFMKWLEVSRFPTPTMLTQVKGIENARDIVNKIENQRNSFPFEVDGAVIKVNNFSLQNNLGVKTKEPRWAIAYKFAAHYGVTKIIDIERSVGRLGTITPVASLEPVRIGGVTVSSSTLHNWDEIDRLGIGIGDTVEVERAGDVIPHVISVKKHGNAGKFPPPTECPECGSAVERTEGGVAFRCIGLNCKAQAHERIKHYSSRTAMDIEGLGTKIVKLLYENELIEHFIDIYKLTKKDLLSLPRFAEKSAQNLLDAINASKSTTLAKFIYALGIIHVGEYAAKLLARNYQKLDDLYNVNEDQIVSIKQMGEKTAKSVSSFFKDNKNLDVLKELETRGLEISNPDFEDAGSGDRPFNGLTFVITGTLTVPRQEVEGLIERNGGHVAKSVSMKTDYVVLGESPGSKFKKAQSLRIKTISYEYFKQMIEEKTRD